jgi:Nitroreductase
MKYRPELTVTNDTIRTILEHHSVREYSDAPISDAHIEAIIAAGSAAATSSNLNSWSVIVVRDSNMRRQLMETTGKNGFIMDAPVFLVWLADLSRSHRMAEQAGAAAEGLKYQEALLIGAVDVALAAQNAVVAAESLGLGTCYVGGIRTNIDQVCKLLELPMFCVPIVGMSLGWPDDNASVKPRLPLTAVAFEEKYDTAAADAGIEALEAETREYFASQGHNGVSWKKKTISRWQSPSALGGREKNRAKIAARGLEDL